jgi:uncharacterized membrane protein
MAAPSSAHAHTHRDFVGSVIGIAVFLGGIGLLVFVFRLAFEMFNIPSSTALDLHKGKPLDLTAAGTSLTAIVLRIFLLLVMGLFGSWIANRGITLYTHSRGIKVRVEEH